MGNRPKRKIVLFLVEGKSDREALQIAVPELFEQIDENIEVFFPIIRDEEEEERGGDITSTLYTNRLGKSRWISRENIEEAIYEMFLDDFFDQEKIMPKDITRIVQIVDTDGVFVADERVREDPKLSPEDSPHYAEDGITCIDAEAIRRRNRQKSANLRYLSGCSSIKVKSKTVPYSVYYFSCNLDHFLHHAINLSYKEKVSRAQDFAGTFIGDPEGFVRFMTEDPAAAGSMSYEESWDFISRDLHSLERHTNLDVLLRRLMAETGRDLSMNS